MRRIHTAGAKKQIQKTDGKNGYETARKYRLTDISLTIKNRI